VHVKEVRPLLVFSVTLVQREKNVDLSIFRGCIELEIVLPVKLEHSVDVFEGQKPSGGVREGWRDMSLRRAGRVSGINVEFGAGAGVAFFGTHRVHYSLRLTIN